jgi:hypothetical protein
MTDPNRNQGEDTLGWRAVRIRRLTDPLGASGHRRTGGRVRRERVGRRTLTAAAVGAFLALLGAIAGGSSQAPPAPANGGVVYAVDPDGTVLAVRIVEREVAQVRTRSS